MKTQTQNISFFEDQAPKRNGNAAQIHTNTENVTNSERTNERPTDRPTREEQCNCKLREQKGQIACHVCNAIESQQSKAGATRNSRECFKKTKINWKNSWNLTTFVYIHLCVVLRVVFFSFFFILLAHIHIELPAQIRIHIVCELCTFMHSALDLPHRSAFNVMFV